MAFYRPDPAMAARLEAALDGLDADGRPGLRNSLAITWVQYGDVAPEAGQGRGASWNQDRILYPASVVKLFYAVAVEQWLQRDLIPESDELARAVSDTRSLCPALVLSLVSRRLSRLTASVSSSQSLSVSQSLRPPVSLSSLAASSSSQRSLKSSS